MKTIPVEEAVGMVLPHDITEIVRGEKKGPAFRKGHVIRPEDIEHLKRIGKNRIYVLTMSEDEYHENDAALLLAKAIAGANITHDDQPVEGKVGFKSTISGLLRVEQEALFRFNMLGEVMLATLHDNTVVAPQKTVAAGRAIPLVIKKDIVHKAVRIAEDAGGLVKVLPWRIKKAAIVVTGREVYEGRIKDAFCPVMTEKMQQFGIDVVYQTIAPDDTDIITQEIRTAVSKGAGLVLCTGGMSVDPDDVTRVAIAKAGATDICYGSPVLPGAMFLVAYLNDIPIVGIPACGMFFKITVFDLVLPRLLAGERITRKDIAALGHGGLCLSCKTCRYPVCPFGKD